jgi:tetratricopeptide (TPR) repeat protein
MPTRHGRACAARWRERATEHQWPMVRLTCEIARCCEVSPLRAHRLARGWTLEQAARKLRAAAMTTGVELHTDPDRLRWWETHPDHRPKPPAIDMLCRLYQTNAQALGLDPAGDYTPAATVIAGLPNPAPAPVAAPADWLSTLRRSVDHTLASASVTTAQLDLLEETLLLHRRQYLMRPPQPMLLELAEDLREVQMLAAERQPASVQQRLSQMTAILATLIADALMKLGNVRQSASWYATARIAADESGRSELRARVHAQAAMLPYYYGPLSAAVRRAHTARLLLEGRPSPTAAFAAAAEARARARAADVSGAEQAMALAQEWFERAEPTSADDAWTFPERRLLLYLSGTLTYLGHTARARATQLRAHALYAKHSGSIDPALLHLDEALCLLREHHLTEACHLAGRAYLEVPAEYRTRILGARARNVIDAVPARMRMTRPARELTEILALPPPSN